MQQLKLTIDDQSCWGCQTCEVACKQENQAVDGIKLISIQEEEPGLIDGRLNFCFHVKVCRHCDEPPCVEVCPESAIRKREDGIVTMDYDLCSGCRACLEACPYDAVAFDEDKNVAQKCNLCHHRVDQGLMPACADNVCLAHCIHFGTPPEV